jgi:hypothetical protein
MLSNLNPSSRVAVLAAIDPDAYSASTQTTGWIDMQDWFAILGVIMAGDLASTATLDAKFEQATDGSGTGAKDVTGSAITQLTQAGTDSNKQVLVNVRQGDLDFNNGFRFVRLSLTLGTAGGDVGAAVLGFDARYGAANAGDAATVDEIVG